MGPRPLYVVPVDAPVGPPSEAAPAGARVSCYCSTYEVPIEGRDVSVPLPGYSFREGFLVREATKSGAKRAGGDAAPRPPLVERREGERGD